MGPNTAVADSDAANISFRPGSIDLFLFCGGWRNSYKRSGSYRELLLVRHKNEATLFLPRIFLFGPVGSDIRKYSTQSGGRNDTLLQGNVAFGSWKTTL